MNEPKLAKIAISSAADTALSESLAPVNADFEGGRITKAELASWYIIEGVKRLDAAAIEKVRKEYFDELAYLASLVKRLKKARAENRSDPEAEEAIRRLSPNPRKGAKGAKPSSLPTSESSADDQVA